jgi:hypothetical protein
MADDVRQSWFIWEILVLGMVRTGSRDSEKSHTAVNRGNEFDSPAGPQAKRKCISLHQPGGRLSCHAQRSRWRVSIYRLLVLLTLLAVRPSWAVQAISNWPTTTPSPEPSPVDRRVQVTMWHCDWTHTGQNLKEMILTPDNVNRRNFGKLFTQPIDGCAFAQPLYMAAVHIRVPSGVNNRVHNVVFVATEHDSVYAFDADSCQGLNASPLWKVSFVDSVRGVSTIPCLDEGTDDLMPEIGITGTPVIDPASGTLYVVSRTKEVRQSGTSQSTHYVQTLHALDIASGAEKFGGPVIIGAQSASVRGTGQVEESRSILQYPGRGCAGDTIIDGRVVFNAFTQNQRPALVLSRGVVYVAWASHADHLPVHGWIAGFNAADLSLQSVVNLSPDGSLSTVWMCGAGPAVDAAGNLYVVTGNGTFDANAGGRDYGESIVKLSPRTMGTHPWENLVVFDYFTPGNFQTLNDHDLDLGSGGPLILSGLPGLHRNELIAAGKEGTVYVVDCDDLGHCVRPGMGPDRAIEVIPANQLLAKNGGTPSSMNSAAYWNGNVYYAGRQRPILQIPLSDEGIARAPSHHGSMEFNYPYPTPQISANGQRNGIVWVQSNGTTGTLYAYDARDVSRELWNSNASGMRDQYGASVKFAMPIIANGKVYVAGQTTFAAFGLLERKRGQVASPKGLQATRATVHEIDLTWIRADRNADGYKIEHSTNGSEFTLIGATDTAVTSFHDTHLNPAGVYWYRVYAYNSTNASAYAGPVQAAAKRMPVTDGIVGWWTFDEGAGNAVGDASPQNRPGSIHGEVSWVYGHVGEAALSFHGAGVAPGYVAISTSDSLRFTSKQSFSIAAWINPANLPFKWAAWLSQSSDTGSSYGISSNPANQWVFGASDREDSLAGGHLTPGWHCIVGIQNGPRNARRLYVDGKLEATGPASDGSGAGELWIGGTKNNDDEFVDGVMDDVRIYRRALSESEVNELTHWCNPSAPANLTATNSNGAVRLVWQPVGENQRVFWIERELDGGGWSDLATVEETQTSYTDESKLAANITYRYRIRAINESGASEYSNVAQVRVDY